MKAQAIQVLIFFIFATVRVKAGPPDGGNRKSWKEQRSVKLFDELKLKSEITWIKPNEVIKHEANCTEGSGSDECTEATIATHYYNSEGNKVYFIVSDLSTALKCVGGKCACAENDTKVVDENERKICIKENLDTGKECIHNKECKDDNVCIFNAAADDNFDTSDPGDIEDLRRFCGGSTSILPAAFLLILLVLGLAAI